MRPYHALFIVLAFSACSNAGVSSLPAPRAGALTSPEQRSQTHGYAQLYSFKGMPDGAYPLKRLLNVNGVLYGTTSWGGTIDKGCRCEQTGTIFKWSPAHGEQVVHVFQDFPDGDSPYAGLIDVKGDLYGTTAYGGDAQNRGTVFKVSASGVESVLYRFSGPRDGMNPYPGLTYANGLLYGATDFGGAIGDCDKGCGTIFSVSLAGSQKVLYRFKNANDGAQPAGNLIYRNGKLYGTAGGGDPYYRGHGVVFAMTPSGHESVIYRFKGEPDGSGPGAGLTEVNGEFYGTTTAGGTKLGGTVYKINSSGKESVVYSFPRKSTPQSGLLYVNGALYGTTTYGGSAGHGTVFKVSLDGKGTIVYSFHGPTDGKSPTGGLINVNGTLYGTTSQGGTSNDGTLFEVSP
jgi:uncharacterized repeat protein (TIGR03803 family)